MKGIAVAMSILWLFTNACGWATMQGPTNKSAEQEIHAALGDMDKRDYASAQDKVERVLQADPQTSTRRRFCLAVWQTKSSLVTILPRTPDGFAKPSKLTSGQ
jgi:Tfp pilus assembly protein PilF